MIIKYLLILGLLSCGKSGSGGPPPSPYPYGGVMGNWECQGNIYCRSHLPDAQRQQQLDQLRHQLGNPQSFRSGGGTHNYQNYVSSSGWKKLGAAFGVQKCYTRRDEGDDGDTFERTGPGADTSHLQRIAGTSRYHSSQNGIHYIVENGTTMYGISFPILRGPTPFASSIMTARDILL